MTIDEILEMMDDLLDKSVTVPFSNKKSIIDADAFRECIDNIRYSMPTEIKRAKNMVADRNEILDEANANAEKIIKEAEERAKVMVSENEVVKQAQEAANDLTAQAKAMDQSIRRAMASKLDSTLSEAENALKKALSEIQAMRTAVKTADKAN